MSEKDGPLYLYVSGSLRQRVIGGELKYGQRLPSERDLAEQYKVDRKTLRRAVQLLEGEGLLTRIQGKGTFIRKKQLDYDVNLIDNFSQILMRSGMTPSTRLLYKERRAAGPKYARILGIAPEDEVYRMVRLRSGDGEAVVLQDTYLRYDVLEDVEDIDFEMHTLYGILRERGIPVTAQDETFTFTRLSSPETQVLGVPEGAISFMVEDVSFGADGKALEYTKSFVNSSKLVVSAARTRQEP